MPRWALIYSRRGAGSFVRGQGIREPLGFGQMENLSDLQHCYDFRLTIEPEAAAMAALRHTPDALARIKSALGLLRDATNRLAHRADADFMFHLSIAQASANPYFSTAMQALEEHIAIGMRFHGMSLRATSGGLQHVFIEHSTMFNAIANRSADAARSLMRTHLTGLATILTAVPAFEIQHPRSAHKAYLKPPPLNCPHSLCELGGGCRH